MSSSCPANYICFKCKMVGNHWIMQCPNNENKKQNAYLYLLEDKSTTCDETAKFRYSKLTQYHQPKYIQISQFEWRSISFSDGVPQKAFLSPDEKYVILEVKPFDSYSQYFTIYDLTKKDIYCSFKSESFKISRFSGYYWISPQFLCCKFHQKEDENGTGIAVLDINKSKMWILEENDGYKKQLFYARNNQFIAINNETIWFYDTTSNEYNVSIDCGVDKIKCIGIKPFKQTQVSFKSNINNNNIDKSEFITKCMKLEIRSNINSEAVPILIMPRYIAETRMITKQADDDYDFLSDYEYDPEPQYYEEEEIFVAVEIYLMDLQTMKILKTNVSINEKEHIDIFYAKSNPQWNWCNNNKFFILCKDHNKTIQCFEYNVMLNECDKSEPYKIECKLLESISNDWPNDYPINGGNSYCKEQIINLHNILIKGTSNTECVYESMAIGYDPFDKDEYESTYYHVLFDLNPNQETKRIQYNIDYIHEAFIDQLSGLILVQSKYKFLDKAGYYDEYGEWTRPYKLGFAVMNPLNGTQIGFISFPQETYNNGTIFADFGATTLLLSGYGTHSIYYCSLCSKQQLFNILKYISSNSLNGFGLLHETLITVIVDLIYYNNINND